MWPGCDFGAVRVQVAAGGTVTDSLDALLENLPVFAVLTVAEDGRIEISQSWKAATVIELRQVMSNYRTGDRLAVKRGPEGWKIEITRRY